MEPNNLLSLCLSLQPPITMKNIFLLLLLTIAGMANAQDSLYREKYRPQYHFTPAHRWIGDPCGTLKHDGRYMAYSWGAASSPDLVHWKELNNHAIKGVPQGVATFTGGIIVDANNTAGYGDSTYVAAFTSFDESSKIQSQSIAFSHDRGETFQYYDLNPVLDIWSTEFRDPTIVRDEKNNRWVMLVAKAREKKVAFYGSENLKDWQWLSDFGPMGDVEKSWECPDLFSLPVDGHEDLRKWVLLVSVNWAREQYFVGDFDGSKFIPDSAYTYALPVYVDHGLDYYASRVFQDYDDPRGPVFTIGWVNTWDYAGNAPSTWGKGIWSLPREYSLVTTPAGLRLRQTPARALESLRGKPSYYSGRLRSGITPLKAVPDMGNSYEMEVKLDIRDKSPLGLYLCEGDGRRLSLSYDPATGCLALDRTNVSDVIIPSFSRLAYLNLPPESTDLKLRVFVDKSTVEIFVNDGEYSLTALTYPGESQTGASVFSLGSRSHVDIAAWPIRSIR